MPFTDKKPGGQCIVCQSSANMIGQSELLYVDCVRCGDFCLDREIANDNLPITNEKDRALASFLIRRMGGAGQRPNLSQEFFQSFRLRSLPSPAEQCDNLLLWLAAAADEHSGRMLTFDYSQPAMFSIVGVIDMTDLHWVAQTLVSQHLVADSSATRTFNGTITVRGWQRVEELRQAHIASNFAFFARQFANTDLDRVFAECLRPTVKKTGYELRTVVQKAGLIDAVIEDDIRRCRFLIADLSDNNAGAYWEAGFAEGLGKPVIYISRAGDQGDDRRTHFDTDHRQTVRWDLSSLGRTAEVLEAVIRNTLATS